jgi:hypothetical protein
MILKGLECLWSFDDNVVSFVARQHPLHVLYEKYYTKCKVPPIDERVECMKKLGKSEKEINDSIKYYIQRKKNSNVEQTKLDAVFAKYKIKPTKKKVLKKNS